MIDESKLLPNSNKYKSEQKEKEREKRVTKVVKGTTKVKKKSELSKIKDRIISEDVGNIKDYILDDVVVPAIKNAVVDTIIESVTMLFGVKRKSRDSRDRYVSYSSISSSRKSRDRFADEYSSARAYDFREVILETRADAEEVLNQLCDCLATYDSVSVADLYDLVGMSSKYTDFDYGWTNLANASYVHIREGYLLKLPRPRPLR